jgi:hypothetical protein
MRRGCTAAYEWGPEPELTTMDEEGVRAVWAGWIDSGSSAALK